MVVISYLSFFVPLIVGFSDVTELILLIAKSPHEITERNSSFCITDGKGTKKTPPTLVFFLRYYLAPSRKKLRAIVLL